MLTNQKEATPTRIDCAFRSRRLQLKAHRRSVACVLRQGYRDVGADIGKHQEFRTRVIVSPPVRVVLECDEIASRPSSYCMHALHPSHATLRSWNLPAPRRPPQRPVPALQRAICERKGHSCRDGYLEARRQRMLTFVSRVSSSAATD